MPNNQNKIIPINYTNREFESIRNDLMQIAERFTQQPSRILVKHPLAH